MRLAWLSQRHIDHVMEARVVGVMVQLLLS